MNRFPRRSRWQDKRDRGFVHRCQRIRFPAWKKILVGSIHAISVLVIPVQCTCPPPAFFQFANNLDVTATTICSGAEILVERIHQFAKVYAQTVFGHIVVDEVVQDPVSQGHKCSHTHDSAKVILSVHSPSEA
jgi:hypothetical protein